MRQDKEGVKDTNLFELFATITLDDSGYKRGLDEAANHTSKFGESLKNGLATAAKVGTASITAAATGIAALTKASVDNYAEYEQLVGGVDTLFKESSQKVQEYAANAYQTAGMSANEYMETVTSFSASLLQSLENDTEAAAEYANMAITDMSDNANKMGTSMEMIQNAYNGFAKQNYTMLDNLKLGYGGTKEEMERLLVDADKLSDSFNLQTDASGALVYSYADIVDAIHIVQTEMGITGTTAAEASQTIGGSLSSVKSAWENLITGIANENADFDKLITNFVNSVSAAAKNIVPRVQVAIKGVKQLVDQLLPVIVKEIPVIIKDVVPELLDAAAELVSAIGQGLLDNADSLLSSALDLVMQLVDFIIQGLPKIQEAAVQITLTLGEKLAEAAPQLITSVTDVIIKLVDMLTDPKQLNKMLNVGLTLISTVGQALVDNVGKITEKIPEIVQNLVDFFLDPEQIGKVIDMGVELLSALISNTAEIINVIVGQLPVIIDGIVNALIGDSGDGQTNLEKIIDAGFVLITSLFDNMPSIIATLSGSVVTIIDKLKDKFLETDWAEVGKDIADSIWDGLKNAWDSLVEGTKELWQEFTNWIDEVNNPTTTHVSASGNTHGGGGGSFGTGGGGSWGNTQNVNINVYSPTEQNLAEIEKAGKRAAAALTQ